MSDDSKEKETKAADLAAKEKALNERETALKAKEAELEKRLAALEKEKADREKAAAADFAEALVKSGQLLPHEKDAVVSVITGIKEATYDFAESGGTVQKPTVDAFKALLQRLPTEVDFSEQSGSDPNDRNLPQVIGSDVDDDKAAAELDQKIQAYATEHGVSYAEAAAQFQE